MFSYHAYGLGIGSSLPLPELASGRGPIDVRIRLGPFGDAPDEGRGPAQDQVVAYESDGAIRLRWPDTGTFLIMDGREIILEPATGVGAARLRLFLLGPALATLLRQRGHLVLHGSAVAIRNHAIVFLGGSGWGKSTLAAACLRHGHRLMADDVAAVDVTGTDPSLLSGYPRLRLWPAGDRPRQSGQRLRVYPEPAKCSRSGKGGFARSARPVRRIYVLDEGSANCIEPLDRQEGLAELLRHSYGARSLWSLRPEGHLAQCAALAARVAVRRLRRRRALEELPDLVHRVEDDLARDAG